MTLKSWAKRSALAHALYYGGKAGMARYHKEKKKAFLHAIGQGMPWTKALPYELRDDHTFHDAQRGREKLCIILAGHKPELWHTVFGRIEAWIPKDVDVCVMTSGVHVPALIDMCAQNGWSYLSTRHNKLTRIQNLAIHLHPKAQYIYKLDEDMFVTQGLFDRLLQTYRQAAEESRYDIAFAAPLIPLNGYGYVRVLEKCGLLDDWERRFGKAVCTDGKHHHAAIMEQGAAAQYMWGETCPVLRDIDALADRFGQEPPAYTVCPIRFSIGAILFSRRSWLDWGMFPVDWTNGMGLDEEHIAHVCMYHGKVGVVSENALAGHLAFGPQARDMLAYYQRDRSRFEGGSI